MTLTTALLTLLTPWQLFLTATGVFLGIIVGVMPGINGAMLIALTLPLTYYMQPNDAMNLLVSPAASDLDCEGTAASCTGKLSSRPCKTLETRMNASDSG